VVWGPCNVREILWCVIVSMMSSSFNLNY
jgi:hypothetical protein